MPFPDNTFDAVYAIEATVHAPSLAGVYSEIFRVLKPGGTFGVYEVSLSFPVSHFPFSLFPKQSSASTSTTIPGEFRLHCASRLRHENRERQTNNIVPQWLMTDKYDASNPAHRSIRLDIEQGDGIANMVRLSSGHVLPLSNLPVSISRLSTS